MDVTCAYSALRNALIYGPQNSFIVFLQILMEILRPDIVDRQNRVKIMSVHDSSDIYDFIIIGGGSAGSVLANRLTENEKSTVLLLEAGGDEPLVSDVPALASTLWETGLDWKFKTEPSTKYCLGLDGDQCDWPRAKALGGSSMHNGMLYVRGNRRDYDQWRDSGNSGWGYDDVLPYFKKSEDMRIPELQDSPYHGTGGYLTVERFRYRPALAKNFLDAFRVLGYNETDLNGANQTGSMYSHGTLRDGLRCSTAKAFLRSASHRKNLHVSTNSMVEKILINETTKIAYGVQFHRGGKKYFVYARTEVILSAGVVQSPQILMLSGIGPKEHLEEIGIEVLHHSPGVGQNLQDHVTTSGYTYTTDVPLKYQVSNNADSISSSTVPKSAAEQFLNDDDGPLFGTGGSAAAAFVNTKYADRSLDFPDVRLGFHDTTDSDAFFRQRYHGKRDNFVANLYEGLAENLTFNIEPSLLRPKSTGHIKLRDANPNNAPLIVPNYFAHPEDLDALVEAAKLGYSTMQTPPMKRINARPNFNSIPECARFSDFSDDYWRCYARYNTATGFHPCCTCKMGPANDSMAVVDPRLRVYGVKALRVVDTSVMPNLVSGNTNAPTIMIAEKAADLIKEDHNIRRTEQGIKAGKFTCTKKQSNWMKQK